MHHLSKFTLPLVLSLSLVPEAVAQLRELPPPPNPSLPDWFRRYGDALALSGDQLWASEAYGPPSLESLERVDVFQLTGSGWAPAGVIDEPSSSAAETKGFGNALVLDGDLGVIGAWASDLPGGVTGSFGRAFVYQRSSSGWALQATLFDPTPAPGSNFGSAIAYAPGVICVGTSTAELHFFAPAAGAGWAHVQTVPIPGVAVTSLAIEGDLLVWGAGGYGFSPTDGRAGVLRRNNGVWSPVQDLDPGVPTQNLGLALGRRVALAGGRAIVSAPGYSLPGLPPSAGARAGSVFVFEQSTSGAWTPTAQLLDPSPTAFAYFGSALAAEGDKVLVGAPYHPAVGAPGRGRVVLFDGHSAWSPVLEARRLGDVIYDQEERLGYAVAMDRGRAVVSAPTEGYVADTPDPTLYSLSTDAVFSCDCSTVTACGNHYEGGGCLNSTGVGAFLDAFGSASLAAGDLRLFASGLPANVFGILVAAAPAPQPIVGSVSGGLFCVQPGAGIPLIRAGLVSSDSLGQVAGPSDYLSVLEAATPGQSSVVAGRTHAVQLWYRDAPTGSCGLGSNLSNSLVFTVLP